MQKFQRATRRNALERLAAISVRTLGVNDDGDDLGMLCELGTLTAPHTKHERVNGDKVARTAAVPMGIRELEALLALCKAAPLVDTTHDAKRLLDHLIPYMPEAHKQALKSTTYMFQLPPWESLSFELTSAVLSLAYNHSSLRADALACMDRTIDALTDSAENSAHFKPPIDPTAGQDGVENVLLVIQLTASILGFLEATASYVQVWNLEQRLGMIQRLRYMLSERFMISLEGALSAVRNARSHLRQVKDWKRWSRHYAARGRPLGAMLLQRGFMNAVERSVVTVLSPNDPIPSDELLDRLLKRTVSADASVAKPSDSMLEELTDIIAEEMQLLQADADYLQVSSAFQQRLALDVKTSSLRSFLCCSLINPDIAEEEALMAWLDAITTDPVQMGDEFLAQTVLKTMAVLSLTSPTMASNLSRSLPRLIVQGKMTSQTAVVAGECLAQGLTTLSQDIVMSTLYTLGNLLSANTADAPIGGASPFVDGGAATTTTIGPLNGPYSSRPEHGSDLSIAAGSEDEGAAVYTAVIRAIVAIARACGDDQVTALVISMLVQKINRLSTAVDAAIIVESANLGASAGVNELKALVKLYTRVMTTANLKGNVVMVSAVNEARVCLAHSIRKQSPLYEVYLTHLLSLSISSGDSAGEGVVDTSLASRTLEQLFRPLAILVSTDPTYMPDFEELETLSQLSRDAWFNIVVHGFTLNSPATRQHAAEIQLLARYTLPLVDEARVDMPESGIELNTVLRRGPGAQSTVEQKSALIAALPACESDIRGLGYPECVYLNTALLVSVLRARVGDCRSVLPYFLENKVKTTTMGICMQAVAMTAVDAYLSKVLLGRENSFAAPQVATQMVNFLEGCCHRIAKVQHAAASALDRIVNRVPSALCQKESLFALLEVLKLMWRSCLDAEIDEYDLKPTYTSSRVDVTIQLSDDVAFRQTTLTTFYKRCRVWVQRAVDVAPLDTKGLLQAYLEDYDDDGAYGHVDLGRSFAVEMSSVIPNSDQRLTSIQRQPGVSINTASDFIAQYTTRQEYRHQDGKPADLDDWTLVERDGASRPLIDGPQMHEYDETSELRELAVRLRMHEPVPFPQIRDTLRKAASVLTRDTADRATLVHNLVGIPFQIFSKHSIELGISLWLGIVKEVPSLESRILVEVASGWEASVYLRKGFFHGSFQHLDPFYVKEEFAASNWEAIKKRERVTHDLISPHLRLTQFLASHLNASRLSAPSVQRIFERLMRITMLEMGSGVSQPLAREVHFQIVLLGLQVLGYNTRLDSAVEWRLKSSILSAGLAWFAHPPRWSYGSNKLQLKAEVKLLGDVKTALQALSAVGARDRKSLPSLSKKQDLLVQLLSHEAGRLGVWISPLESDAQHLAPIAQMGLGVKDTSFLPLVEVAWQEDPRIAVQLTTRFSSSEKLSREVRSLLLTQSEKAIHEPDALHLLLGSSLPDDVKDQLRYLLYWAPVNPMAAVMYFMPAYGNHPSIIQYAVRALESHSVDVTFFYVPQIVQALRYDALGYVERYIIETAKFSQLFAHQIIWNMKANAFKDEESQVADPVKPALDQVMEAMISSFSDEDRGFYEREFDFFGRVTGISGTLKPLIKRPKPEKKQMIEEELRKIQVEVGVYLPSNPDGVVIGIDRKSGKPLQSHAKAPFMATFRIRKEEGDLESMESQDVGEVQSVKKRTYETWQSAIFKVGDDCRQDVLALQMIAAFRGIFNSVGLDVYVFPYRVTATAPGCGVIDVLPNSISRDMLGREAVNGLYEYFISKYGYEDSIRFQEGRSNFIKSMAAYSIISYLLQFKDRHNGNIMVDEAGHILHIDFGFCFDIVPGGVRFERAPFKLTPEMMAVMGGSAQSAPFKAFEELCVKVFLAARQYVEQLSHIVTMMLDSGLPCFKPTTIQHFKERFVLEKSDREAADFVRKLVHWSAGSYSTGVYDYYQLLTNGIPY